MAGILDSILGLFSGAPAAQAGPLSNQLIPGMDFLGAPGELSPMQPSLGAFPDQPGFVSTAVNNAPESILNPPGLYDPAVGNALASGDFAPIVDTLSAAGVEPPAAGAAPGGAGGLGGMLSGLRGVVSPPAPDVPRVDTPPPPRPTGGADPASVIRLIEQMRGGPGLPLRLGQAAGNLKG